MLLSAVGSFSGITCTGTFHTFTAPNGLVDLPLTNWTGEDLSWTIVPRAQGN